MRLLLLITTSIFFSFLTLARGTGDFLFNELVYMVDGKDLNSNEVPIYENLSVRVDGIQGFLLEEGFSELGMEVVITDVNSNRFLYSPDMLVDTRLSEEDLKNVHFDINLNEDFKQGEEYFIKIKIWDKKTKKSFSKHSSFTVVEGLRNENLYIDVRRLKVAGCKLYLNSDRLYKSNRIRIGDELVVDLFFSEMDIEKGEDIIIISEIIDEQNSKKHRIENDFAIVDKTQLLKSVLIKNVMYNSDLKAGNSYIFHLQFHNASRNQKLDLKFRFTLLNADWQKEAEKVGSVSLDVDLNKEKTKSNPVVEIGDRLDLNLFGFENKQHSDFGFGKLGGKLIVRDGNDKVIHKTSDIFNLRGVQMIIEDEPVSFKYVIPSNLQPGGKYSIEILLWDKYSNAYASKKFSFKMAKTKELPFGLQDNVNLKCRFLGSRISPVSVYVSQNGYKIHTNNLKVNDEIEMITSVSVQDDYEPKSLTRITELHDEAGNVLMSDEEEMIDFKKGEVIASMIIPETGVEFNRSYYLFTILKDEEEELMKVEYKFYIEK